VLDLVERRKAGRPGLEALLEWQMRKVENSLGCDGTGVGNGKPGPGRGRDLPVGARQEIGPEGLAHLPLGLGDGPGREPEVDGAPVLSLQVLEAPAHDLRELVDEGTTVLLTTQYLEEADQLAERVAVIDGGLVIANDTPERLKADLGDTVVEMDFADEALAGRALALLEGDGLGSVEHEHRTVRVSSNRGAHVLVDVLRRFDGDGVEPDTLSVREPSLDDVFMALTGHKAVSDEIDEGEAR